jgi:IS30 family transposase
MKQVDRYTSEKVREGIEAMISQDDLPFKSLAVDNGHEFACHEQITDQFEIPIYFAYPYHFWERGLNENTNGLVRQYFTRGASFKRITDAQVQRVQDRLKHRPRKSLGHKSPHEILVEGKRIKLQDGMCCTYYLNPR